MHCRRRRTSEGQDEADSTVLSNRGVRKALRNRFSECEPTTSAVVLRPETSGSNGGISGRVAPAQRIGRPRFERRNCWTGAGASDTLGKPAMAGGTFGSKWRPVLMGQVGLITCYLGCGNGLGYAALQRNGLQSLRLRAARRPDIGAGIRNMAGCLGTPSPHRQDRFAPEEVSPVSAH